MGAAKNWQAKAGVTDTTDKDTTGAAAKNIVLASRARGRTRTAGLEADGDLVWTYKHALYTEADAEKNCWVTGSGAIGIRICQLLQITLGADVTVDEVQDRILPVEDAEISACQGSNSPKQGMTIPGKTNIQES